MLKEFMMKQLLKRQLKGVPEEEIDKLIEMVSKDPALFQKIAEKAQAKIKQGKSQMDAITEAASEHREELEKLMKE